MAIHPLPLILASSSKSRAKLLDQSQLKYSIHQSKFDESTVTDKNHQTRITKLAQAKAMAVSQTLKHPALILAADTFVIYNNRVMEKPKYKMTAVDMLKQLSGNIHTVLTGWAILNSYKHTWKTGLSETYVTFRQLTHQDIVDYIDDNPVTQWAGGYNSSLSSAVNFITKVRGSLTGLNGLPLDQVAYALKQEWAHPYKTKSKDK